MWNSKYGELNKDLIDEMLLLIAAEKIKKIKKYPKREYVVLEENIQVVKESIKNIFESAFSNKQITDNDYNCIDSFDLDLIVNDIVFILYLSGNSRYKETFLQSYIANIKNKEPYKNKIVNKILNLGNSVIFPMVKDLFNFEDIFIEDLVVNKENRNEITIIAIKFLI